MAVEKRRVGGRGGSLESADVVDEVGEGVARIRRDEIDLRPVAGVEDEDLFEGVFAVDSLQEPPRKVRPEGERFPHRHGGGLVVQPDDRKFPRWHVVPSR